MNKKALKAALNYTYDNSKLNKYYFYILIIFCISLYYIVIDVKYLISIPILMLEILFFYMFCIEIKSRYKDNLNNIIYLSDGKHIIYDKYGIKENICLKNGKKDGLYEQYYNNGQLKIKCFYVEGIIEGEYEEYYSNGKIKIKSFYDKPFPLVVKEINYEEFNYKEWEKQTFQELKNRQQGFQYYYNEEGVLLQKSNFVDNIMVSFEEYYKNGKLRMVNFKENYCYYSDDNKKTCEIIVDKKTLKPKGIWINYDVNETINYKLNFDFELDTIVENEDVLKIIYDKSGNIISSEIIKFQLSDDFEYYVKTYYAEDRFNEMAYKHYGSTGAFKGCKEEIILDPILTIDDFTRNRRGELIRVFVY